MRIRARIIAAIIIAASFLKAYAAPPAGWIDWSPNDRFPVAEGLSGMVTGISNGVMIVAGGSNFSQTASGKVKTIYDAIYISRSYRSGSVQWEPAGKLPGRLTDAAVVPYKNGLIVIGGTNGQTDYKQVLFLWWDPAKQQVSISTPLPQLPQPRSALSAAILGDRLYIAGGRDAHQQAVQEFFSVGLPEDARAAHTSFSWKPEPLWPGAPRFGAVLVSQGNGERNVLYLAGGKTGQVYLKDIYRFDPFAKQPWQRMQDAPRPALFAGAATAGQSHILLFGGSDGHDADRALELGDRYHMPGDILAYHTITDSWVKAGNLPAGVAGAGILVSGNEYLLVGGELRPQQRLGAIQRGTLRSSTAKSAFGFMDYGIIFVYLALLAVISFYFSRKKQTADGFLRGGQQIPYWAVGISVMATQVSAIGFMSIPAKAYATNWTYFSGVWTWFLVVPVVTWAFIPFYRKLNLTSAYEYLEKRFSLTIRLFSGFVYCLYQLGRMGLVVYLPAIALSAVAPIDTMTCIIIMGVLSTVYTVAGGIEAVIWIEVLQAILLMGGALVCVIMAINGTEGGAATFWHTATEYNKFSVGSLDFDFTSSSLIVLLIGNIFIRLGNLISDQAIVQRYMTTKSLGDARKSLWMDVKVSVPWAIIIYLLGTSLYVFYKSHPQLLNPGTPTDGILPHFISHQAPPGLSGLIIAAIFAASMATIESHIHSVATIFTVDFYRRFSKNTTGKKELQFARYTTALLGLLATGLAILLLFIDVKSILDLFTEMTGVFLGAAAGLFVLGIFTEKTNSTGALAGAVASSILILVLQSQTRISFWLYSAIGMTTCFLIGYTISLLFPGRKETEGLTIFTINKKIKQKHA
ncbi:MAG: sodium/solute symporter [Niabella sp.]